MELLPTDNAFGAPVYRVERVASTMDEARRAAANGALHGTVIVADEQEAGRGRVAGRVWKDEKGRSLLCTTVLRFTSLAAMPPALTLRVGLAACRAVEDAAPALRGRVLIKWPNDLMVSGRKLCGILCESDGKTVLAGVGINVGQTAFPEELEAKATSIAIALRSIGNGASSEEPEPDRFTVLARLLSHMRDLLSPAADADFRSGLETRLFRRGERVRFMVGAADSDSLVEGILAGIGPSGELLLLLDGESKPSSFATGELLAYRT